MGNAVFVTMASVSLNINYLFFAHEHYEDHIWGQTERTAQHTVVFCSGAIPNRILAWTKFQFFSLSHTPPLLCVVVWGCLLWQLGSAPTLSVLRVRCHHCSSVLSWLMSPRITIQ